MVNGAVGGMIDVNGLVAQLMQIERQPLQRLESRETQIQSRLSAFGRVAGALAALESALGVLARSSTFSAAKVTVTGEGVTAVASQAPSPGRYAVSVSQLARTQSTASIRVASASTDIGSGTLTIRNADGSQVLGTFTVGDAGTGTLAELRDKINAAAIGVRASLIGDGGEVRLVLNSSETGAANAFVVDTDAGLTHLGFAEKQAAQDAAFTVNGLALSSPSNVVRDALEGVTLTLNKAPPAGSPAGSTVDGEVLIGTDSEKIAAAVKDFVRAYNDAQKLIAELTRFDPNMKTAALLNGESVLRRIQGDLASGVRASMTAAAGEFSRLSEIGIAIQSDGALRLDEGRLAELAAADPGKLARLFSATSAIEYEQGIAQRLQATAKAITGPSGLLASRQEGLRASIRTLDQQQERMQARLVLIEQRLRRQYSQLDALMATSQSQSNALANALAGLPSLQDRR
jgi:flagellar hook-associated protein 2